MIKDIESSSHDCQIFTVIFLTIATFLAGISFAKSYIISNDLLRTGWFSVGIYSCGGNTFTIACNLDEVCLIDTHPVPERVIGNGNGAFIQAYESNAMDLVKWIQKYVKYQLLLRVTFEGTAKVA